MKKNMKKLIKKIRKFIVENKVVAIGIVVLIMFIAVLAILTANTNKEEKTITKYENIVKDIAASYYKEYYNMIVDSQSIEYIKGFNDIGWEFDLDNMINLLPSLKKKAEKLINPTTKEQCNTTGTKVKIYPQDPYGESDYTIEVTLDCGFNK